jgi:uncharacterized protein YndB with AHSA1/START domain
VSGRGSYRPGPAAGAEVRKDGERWTLVLTRELRHPPEQVWRALTDPAELREWAPFDADRALGTPGPVKLSTVGTPTPNLSDSEVTRADAPTLLEYTWGGNAIRWRLEPSRDGTRLTLWHAIDKRFVSMGAGGWHICLDVLGHWLGGDPLGRIVGGDAMQFDWPRLNLEYARQFGIEAPQWPPKGSSA